MKTILHLKEDLTLSKKEVSEEKYNELLKEAEGSYIVLHYYYEHEISGEERKDLQITPLEADYIVEDKDGRYVGLYLLKNKERINKSFDYPETFVDILGRFGFRDSYTSSGDIFYTRDKDLYLHYQGKDVIGLNMKPLVLTE